MSIYAVYLKDESNELSATNLDGVYVSLQAEDICPWFDYTEWEECMISRASLKGTAFQFVESESVEQAISQYKKLSK